MPPEIQPRTYSLKEAAQLLGVSLKIASDAAKSGELETIRVGKRLRILRAPLDAKLAGGTSPKAA